MELVIRQEETKQTVGFTVKVDTEDRNFKKGDIIVGYVQEFPNFQDKNAPSSYTCLLVFKGSKIG